ncbi:MAG: dihydropteroate synthase [Clostridium sp.]|nr:dihydropteroate synthase [Clostridium sp.]MCM1400143.1 dihydropteroate synthase [Clostridium sp.]MCM1460830.1 dihydropteroate synthase [Bacteroides sp.]
MQIGNTNFEIGRRPYIMGILNVTPDSFSDGGNYTNVDKALKRTKQMIDEGADIIDVGGESTRPGYVKISEQEEIERTCFIIEAIKENFNIPVSLDTYKPKVAQAGILAGADMINDIWGLKWDDAMAETIARFGVACCLMHNRHEAAYRDFLREVVSGLQESVDMALAAGIRADKVMLDPGVGFAKDTKQNLSILNHLKTVVDMGYPVLLGTSRKSVIGNVLGLPVDERVEGTVATSVIGLMSGCTFFRVHDVLENYRALKMADAIRKEIYG